MNSKQRRTIKRIRQKRFSEMIIESFENDQFGDNEVTGIASLMMARTNPYRRLALIVLSTKKEAEEFSNKMMVISGEKNELIRI